jgi:hypothetical protein
VCEPLHTRQSQDATKTPHAHKCLCGIFYDILGGHCETVGNKGGHELPKSPSAREAVGEFARMTKPWSEVVGWFVKARAKPGPENFFARKVVLNRMLGITTDDQLARRAERDDEDTVSSQSIQSNDSQKSHASQFTKGYIGFLDLGTNLDCVDERSGDEYQSRGGDTHAPPSRARQTTTGTDTLDAISRRSLQASKDLSDALGKLVDCARQNDAKFMVGVDVAGAGNKLDTCGMVVSTKSYGPVKRKESLTSNVSEVKDTLSNVGMASMKLMGDLERYADSSLNYGHDALLLSLRSVSCMSSF